LNAENLSLGTDDKSEYQMARELQNRVLGLVELVTGTAMEREVSPSWLMRPGQEEAVELWSLVSAIFTDLTGTVLPDEMPLRERRSIDAMMIGSDSRPRIVEVDEVQHFTPPRAQTLALYPSDTVTAFDRAEWCRRSAAVTKLRGGGFGRACPPLFPNLGGRHLQRAFRDALADLLPQLYGWAPTLRIADFEVKVWMHEADAPSQMAALLASKGL
jgi:hypothetical protein